MGDRTLPTLNAFHKYPDCYKTYFNEVLNLYIKLFSAKNQEPDPLISFVLVGNQTEPGSLRMPEIGR